MVDYCNNIFEIEFSNGFFNVPIFDNLIIMKYYVNYSDTNIIRYYSILWGRKGLFDCVMYMHSLGYYHVDIKLENVLFIKLRQIYYKTNRLWINN